MERQKFLGVIREIAQAQENVYRVSVVVYRLDPLQWVEQFSYSADRNDIVQMLLEAGVAGSSDDYQALICAFCEVQRPVIRTDGTTWVVMRMHDLRTKGEHQVEYHQ